MGSFGFGNVLFVISKQSLMTTKFHLYKYLELNLCIRIHSPLLIVFQ